MQSAFLMINPLPRLLRRQARRHLLVPARHRREGEEAGRVLPVASRSPQDSGAHPQSPQRPRVEARDFRMGHCRLLLGRQDRQPDLARRHALQGRRVVPPGHGRCERCSRREDPIRHAAEQGRAEGGRGEVAEGDQGQEYRGVVAEPGPRVHGRTWRPQRPEGQGGLREGLQLAVERTFCPRCFSVVK